MNKKPNETNEIDTSEIAAKAAAEVEQRAEKKKKPRRWVKQHFGPFRSRVRKEQAAARYKGRTHHSLGKAQKPKYWRVKLRAARKASRAHHHRDVLAGRAG